MTYKYTTYFKWVHLIIDYIIINFCVLLALSFEGAFTLTQGLADRDKLNFLLLNLLWFYCAKLVGLYNNILKRDASPTMKVALLALVLFYAAIFALDLSFPSLQLSFQFLLIFQALLAFLLLSWKFYFLALRREKRKFWIEHTPIAILGASLAGLEISKYIQANPQFGYKVAGIFDDDLSLQLDDLTLLGKVDDCFAYASKAGIAEVYCALPHKEAPRIKKLMQQADQHMVRFRMMADINDLLDHQVFTKAYGRLPILTPRQEPLENKANEIRKRIFDLVFSLLVTVFLLSWLIPLVGLLIKLDSKGPVFFKQLRSGKNNKSFYCYKFRSMTVNTDSDQKQASKNDGRITKLGAFLRRTSMDELPQFINVLLGDMSVVGPRPHMLKHTLDYSAVIDNYMVRHFLTPGITGWAQVNGFRGETKERESMLKRVQADIWYLEHWSLLLDIKIVFLTIWQAIKGNENAY